ncbi:hypothetical protein [Parendozoicomonas sp. Alg238-R29]|uniref:hypothetical protein n=1 Tax=Parendozoicomonas sp. Alg238-R29 TaxID=2993446 RepID=UPI00248DE80D|nr:hypothetical protein [Parendozoicomonas sp. Alg238-R29]
MSYLINHDFENYYSLTIDVADLTSKMPSYSQRFRAKPRLENWVAPKSSFYKSENHSGKEESIPDITTWALGNLVLSPNAYKVLNEKLASSGEFLPLLVGDKTYYMFNTLFVIPEHAIDLSEAVDVIDSGVHMGKKNVKFDESKIEDHLVFKSKTNKLTYSFATEKFKSMYSENNLTGLTFKKSK